MMMVQLMIVDGRHQQTFRIYGNTQLVRQIMSHRSCLLFIELIMAKKTNTICDTLKLFLFEFVDRGSYQTDQARHQNI